MSVIRQLKNFFTGKVIYPKTLTKAVYDENGERLDKILRDTMLAVDSEEYNGVEPRDADTLGGKYKADDITAIKEKVNEINSSLTLDFSNASPDVQDINTLLQNLLNKFYPNALYIINGNNVTSGYSFKTSEYSNVVLENGVYKYTRNGAGGANANILPSIDFTSYNKIVMEFSDNSATVELGYADQSGIDSAAAITNKVNTTINSGKIEYDISQITGKYYIYFFMSDIVSSSFVINKLYLE